MSPLWIFLVCTIMDAVNNGEQTPAFDNTNSPIVSWPDWMSSLADEKSLANIAMPGTHDTMSFYGGVITECQSWPLIKQYEAGIRFVDIRCRRYNNRLRIHHGIVYQCADYADVLRDSIQFLLEHPSETILMRVKEDYKAFNSTLTFKETVAKYMEEVGSWWFLRTSSVPTLGEARGKIIILQNFNPQSDPLGIPYPGSFSISDEYEAANANQKWDAVKGHISSALKGNPKTTYLTYTSGSNWPIYTPVSLARKINPTLFIYLNDEVAEQTRSVGVIIMDFPGAELAQCIIRNNKEFE